MEVHPVSGEVCPLPPVVSSRCEKGEGLGSVTAALQGKRAKPVSSSPQPCPPQPQAPPGWAYLRVPVPPVLVPRVVPDSRAGAAPGAPSALLLTGELLDWPAQLLALRSCQSPQHPDNRLERGNKIATGTSIAPLKS